MSPDWWARVRARAAGCESRPTHSLARALELGLVPPGLVDEARRIVNSYSYPRPPTRGRPGRADDAAPSWDNAVRAYEEDR